MSNDNTQPRPGCPRCASPRWGQAVGWNVCGCGHVWPIAAPVPDAGAEAR